nr:reverse transcriptase domain-containing protein [Tanacetum cinerariifolium]
MRLGQPIIPLYGDEDLTIMKFITALVECFPSLKDTISDICSNGKDISPLNPKSRVVAEADMTSVPRSIEEHHLNIREGSPPIRQKEEDMHKTGTKPSRSRDLEVYVDEIVIKSYTEKEILKDIEETFQVLRRINMKLNPKKCTFEAKEGMFLGYFVNVKRIKACSKKAKAVMKLHSPRMLKESRTLQLQPNLKIDTSSGALFKEVKKVLPVIRGHSHYGSADQANPIMTRKSRKNSKVALRAFSIRHQLQETNIYTRPNPNGFHCKKTRRRCSPYRNTSGRKTPGTMDSFHRWILMPRRIQSRGGGEEKLLEPWTLFIDGSSCLEGFRVGFILTNPEGIKFTYALRFEFDASNNEAKYETLMVGLQIAKQIEEEGYSWITPLFEYLTNGTLPRETKKARAIRIKERQYAMINGV